MGFRARKVYGESKVATCPFCGAQAIAKNNQGLEVCRAHMKQVMEDVKCSCGSWLETRSGKFGPYFNCMNCGNINYRKGMEMKELNRGKELTKSNIATAEKNQSESVPSEPRGLEESIRQSILSEKKTHKSTAKKEITITSDDVEYFD
jgi:hypothetical protein